MMPEEHLMVALNEDEFFLENLIQEYQNKQKLSQRDLSAQNPLPGLESWLLRCGMSPACHLSQNRIGFYADFT